MILYLKIQVKPKDAITSILPLPSRDESSLTNYFLTTGRDGKFRIYEIKSTPGGVVEAPLLHETSPPFGSARRLLKNVSQANACYWRTICASCTDLTASG